MFKICKYIVVILLIAVTFPAVLSGCLTDNQQPVEVVSMLNPHPPIGQPIIPAGPTVEITLKNVSDKPVISLTATLEQYRSFEFIFDVTPSNPLLPGDSVSSKQVLIQGGFNDNSLYPLVINTTLQNGDVFAYTKQIQITLTAVPLPTSPLPPRDWEQGSAPPVGIEGLSQPALLTEDEKAEVIQIALSSQRVSEWLQKRTDYRTGLVDWYAIIWDSEGEAGTWWSLEYDRIANEGVPGFVNPYAFWYPGVTIAVGEGTIYQMQVAVDLDAGKIVMAMGPYPSLSSPDRFKNFPTP